MTAYIIRRMIALVPVLIVVSLITFFLLHLTPGGPFEETEGRRNDPVMRARMEASFGLNKPVWQQYFIYIGNAARLDLGPSFASLGSITVTDILKEHLGYSAKLGAFALLFAVIVGVPLGIL